jgi:four helix bundle protein
MGMKMNCFEDVLAWQQARNLTILIYQCFKSCKDYSFRDQIQRASVSIVNNIAEGFERKTDKEFKYFLFIAKGSCGEVRSMLTIATDVGYVTPKQQDNLSELATSTSKLLAGFIKKL